MTPRSPDDPQFVDSTPRRAPAVRPGATERKPRARLRLLAAAVIVALLAPAALPLTALAAAPATDGPGALSHFDLARKDCLGTAANSSSKVWYTVANGVLSDVYYPTIDNTNVETLQLIVTDGSTFTDLATRDMTYTVNALDQSGMACRVTSTAKSGKYRLVTDYVTDPSRNSVLMQTLLTPLVAGTYHVYARLDPTVNGNGGGGSGNGGADSATVDTSTGHPIPVSYDTVTATQAANNNYRQPVYAALDGPFGQVESGFAGQGSDGLTQLDASHALTGTTTDALSGNVVQTASINPPGPFGRLFTLALGFGSTQAGAVASAEGSLHRGFLPTFALYQSGWAIYDAHLNRPPFVISGLTPAQVRAADSLYYTSANVLKASVDKTFPGAIAASVTSPWGQAISAGDPANTYFGSYREVFARDLYEAWTGLMADGDLATARDAVNFLFLRQQQADGSMPRNSLLNGKTAPDSFGTQLDETAYPILMADQMGMFGNSLYVSHVKPAAMFIVSHGPSFGVERWEEQSGYSPSTIAAEIAGLVAAADIARHNGDTTSAQLFLGVADDYQRSIKGWTVTTNGPLSASPYFIRLSKTGDPNAAISYNVGNGGPTLDQRSVMDAGFLELVRLGELPASDPTVAASIPVLDTAIESTTASGPGWHRYNGDGYGDHSGTGAPWAPSGQGTGHLWPPLSVERGEYDIVSGGGPSAASLVPSFSGFASGVGLIPEQVWELPNLRGLAVWHRSDDRFHRLRQRTAGRFRGTAHLVRGCVRATHGRPAGRSPARHARDHDRAVRQPHPGGDPDLHYVAGEPERRDRARRSRSRARARPATRWSSPPPTPTRTPPRPRPPRPRPVTAAGASRSRSRAGRASSTPLLRTPPAPRATPKCRSSGTSPRAPSSSARPIRRATTTVRATTHIPLRRTSWPAPTTSRTSRSSSRRTAPRRPSSSRPAT